MKINLTIKDKVRDKEGYFVGQKIKTAYHGDSTIEIVAIQGDKKFIKRLERHHRNNPQFQGVVLKNTETHSSSDGGVDGYCVEWIKIKKE